MTSTTKYDVTLTNQGVGSRKSDVLKALLELNPNLDWDLDHLERVCQIDFEPGTGVYNWRRITSERLAQIREKLEMAGATLDIRESTVNDINT